MHQNSGTQHAHVIDEVLIDWWRFKHFRDFFWKNNSIQTRLSTGNLCFAFSHSWVHVGTVTACGGTIQILRRWFVILNCDGTFSCTRHDSFEYIIFAANSQMSFIIGTQLFHVRQMTHAYALHDKLFNQWSYVIHKPSKTTHTYLRRVSCLCLSSYWPYHQYVFHKTHTYLSQK